jgi:hypothetical protein
MKIDISQLVIIALLAVVGAILVDASLWNVRPVAAAPAVGAMDMQSLLSSPANQKVLNRFVSEHCYGSVRTAELTPRPDWNPPAETHVALTCNVLQ